jgi:hypothetical protein
VGIDPASARLDLASFPTLGRQEKSNAADILSDVLRTVRLTGAAFFDVVSCDGGAPTNAALWPSMTLKLER